MGSDTIPVAVSPSAPGGPLAVVNASLSAIQTTLDLGKQFLGRLGI